MSTIIFRLPLSTIKTKRRIIDALSTMIVLGLAIIGMPTTLADEDRADVEISTVYSSDVKVVNTSISDIYLETFHVTDDTYGGGIVESPDGDGVFLISKSGEFYYFGANDNNGQMPKRLRLAVPMNKEALLSRAGEKQNVNQNDWFLVTDVYADTRGEDIVFYVSHHYFRAKDECITLRLSSLSIPAEKIKQDDIEQDWQTLFDSIPCMKSDRWASPAGRQSGGRIVRFSDKELLLAIGDHGFDGMDGETYASQDMSNTLGKVVVIDEQSGAWEIFSSGHRNPQGLAVDNNGTVWETEHGPQGGDELNVLIKGENYGWPLETYGVDYNTKHWPLSHRQMRHELYHRPIFAWVPSIGVSNLIQVTGNYYPGWEGDLIIASLKEASLYRVRYQDNRVIFCEPIHIGERIRDLVQLSSGRIVLWTDSGNIVYLHAAPQQQQVVHTNGADQNALPNVSSHSGTRGMELFTSRCAFCHGIPGQDRRGIGPDLSGIVGRQIASDDNFNYSIELENIQGIWNREILDSYLKDPSKFAPGTYMTGVNIAKDEEREAILDYLDVFRAGWEPANQ